MNREDLATRIAQMGAPAAADALEELDGATAAALLQHISPAIVGDILPELDPEHREELMAAAPAEVTRQWSLNLSFPDESVGRLMETPPVLFQADETVAAAAQRVRAVPAGIFFTYCYIVDPQGRLVGIVTMRDLLVADDHATLSSLMLTDLFTLTPTMALTEAMKLVVHRHFPVYPVCDADGKLLGQVRGRAMFEERAFEISAQPGLMVGVNEEERAATPWRRSLRFRQPWLQLNLITSLAAAAVVGLFQGTVDQLVILALFIPVVAALAGNTGCQAVAVSLRAITLGELREGISRALVAKEAAVGLLNGTLVGASAGIVSFAIARAQGEPRAVVLGGVVALAMVTSCVVAGVWGTVLPFALRRLGTDPATASSILLMTVTDTVSLALFLGLSTMLLLH